MIFFSIIIPTKNCASTIADLLISVINQTESDYEVILIDSMSTDNTLEVVDNYKFSKSTIISEPDLGIYDAMNKGVSIATGEWLYFIGADDILYNRDVLSLVRQSIISRKQNYDLYYCDYIFKGKVCSSQYSWRLLFTNSVNHQSAFYNRRIFQRMSYSLDYKLASDYLINLRLYLDNKLGCYLPIIVANFCDTGVSNTHFELSNAELKAIRKELIPYISGLIEFIRNARKLIIRLKLFRG